MSAKVIQLNRPSPSVEGPVTPEKVKNQIKFLDILNEYAKKAAIENSFRPKTVNRYRYYIANIEKYLKESGQMEMTLDHVRIKTVEEMVYWLQTEHHKASLGHASRHAEMCKRALNYALVMEYTFNNPLTAYKAKRGKIKEVVHLEKHELELLINFDVESIPRKSSGRGSANRRNVPLRKNVVDLYIFQCYTGLSYGDLYTYSVIEKEGRLWISNRRYKNDTPYYVPLFPEAQRIHEKYNGKLPLLTDQCCNSLIQVIAKAAGIKKHLTTHTARKTFATHRDNEGWSTKTIADMMGNTLEVLQKHYLAKSTKRIETEMALLGY